MVQAERVATVMDVRGYCEDDPGVFRPVRFGLADVVTLGLALGVLGTSIMLRF